MRQNLGFILASMSIDHIVSTGVCDWSRCAATHDIFASLKRYLWHPYNFHELAHPGHILTYVHVQPFARLLVKSSSIYAYHVVMSNIIFAYRVFCSIIIGKGTCHMPRGGSFQSRNYDSNPPNPSWRPINNTSMRTKVRWEPLSHYHLNLIIALSWNTYQYEIVMQIILRTLLFQFCGRPCKVSGIAKSLTKIVFLVIICFGSITLYCIVWVTSLPPSDKRVKQSLIGEREYNVLQCIT